MLLHLGFGDRGDWRVLTAAAPRLRLIFAHAGIPHYDRIWGAIRADRRLALDVSSPYLDEALVRDAVAAVGPERVLYGTDAPYGFHDPDSGYDYGAIRGWVERTARKATGAEVVGHGGVAPAVRDWCRVPDLFGLSRVRPHSREDR